jgi:hypothetical protein
VSVIGAIETIIGLIQRAFPTLLADGADDVSTLAALTGFDSSSSDGMPFSVDRLVSDMIVSSMTIGQSRVSSANFVRQIVQAPRVAVIATANGPSPSYRGSRVHFLPSQCRPGLPIRHPFHS